MQISFARGDGDAAIGGDGDVSKVVAAAQRYDAAVEGAQRLAESGKAKAAELAEALVQRVKRAMEER